MSKCCTSPIPASLATCFECRDMDTEWGCSQQNVVIRLGPTQGFIVRLTIYCEFMSWSCEVFTVVCCAKYIYY